MSIPQSTAPAVGEGHPALIQYPAHTLFGRRIPKETVYSKSGANRRVKDLFVAQVEHIVWQHKLAPATLRLPAGPGVQEIQVLHIALKTTALDDDVLRCIDRAVPSPLVFELGHGGQTRVVACHKRPSEADSTKWVTSDYFGTGWLPADAPRQPLPVALDLPTLYAQLLQRLLPCAPRAGEDLNAHLARVDEWRAVQRTLERTRRRLQREIQFNRKIEINAQLRQLQQQWDALGR